MKNKPIVCLLIISSVFTMSVNVIYGEESLIFHDQQTVYLLSTSPGGEPIRKELINDADLFNINRSGYFTMRDGSHGNEVWYKGRIDSSFNVTKQPLPHAGILSEDGKRIAWNHSEGLGSNASKSELTIEEYVGNESKVIRKVSVDGFIPAFSFSPNSGLLAYFSGPPDAVVIDGFSLMLIDLNNPEKQPLEIAPPSLRTRPLNPNRSNPLWSPNGELILFEARYKNDESLRGSHYIVSIDGRTLEPSPGGKWDQEGKYINRLERVGDYGSGEYMVIETDVSSNTEKKYPITIGSSSVSLTSLSPSGQKIAYVVNKEIFVYDTTKKTTISYGVSQNSAFIGREFFWIFLQD